MCSSSARGVLSHSPRPRCRQKPNSKPLRCTTQWGPWASSAFERAECSRVLWRLPRQAGQFGLPAPLVGYRVAAWEAEYLTTSVAGRASFWSGVAAPRSRDVPFLAFTEESGPLWGPTGSASRGPSCDMQPTPLSLGLLPGDGVPLTHSPGGGSQRDRHTRGAHAATSGRRNAAVRPRLFWLPARCPPFALQYWIVTCLFMECELNAPLDECATVALFLQSTLIAVQTQGFTERAPRGARALDHEERLEIPLNVPGGLRTENPR